jgi:ATP-dependent DNA helicase RecG
MAGDEKQRVMAEFRSGRIQALMATSVVEVGVDVPNATLMTIFGAQRFGLAQLHQLRGRVSRGKFPGFCCLMVDELTPEAKQRLQALLDTTDGFRLAEIDFELRGPGELLGTRQHGLAALRIADLRRDKATLDEARRDAQALVADDAKLARPELALLRRMMLVRYGAALDLADVG